MHADLDASVVSAFATLKTSPNQKPETDSIKKNEETKCDLPNGNLISSAVLQKGLEI